MPQDNDKHFTTVYSGDIASSPGFPLLGTKNKPGDEASGDTKMN